MTGSAQKVRFRVNIDKCIDGIDFLASRKPGITQFYLCKVFYLADKEHLLDWGRPISGDRYVAMEHGPVPSFIYDIVKSTSGEPDEIVDQLIERVRVVQEQNRLKVFSRGGNDYRSLSKTDIGCLETALDKYGSMPFGELRQITHEDPAYVEAWGKEGLNNEMDIRLWFDEGRDTEAIAQVEERALYSVG